MPALECGKGTSQVFRRLSWIPKEASFPRLSHLVHYVSLNGPLEFWLCEMPSMKLLSWFRIDRIERVSFPRSLELRRVSLSFSHASTFSFNGEFFRSHPKREKKVRRKEVAGYLIFKVLASSGTPKCSIRHGWRRGLKNQKMNTIRAKFFKPFFAAGDH